MIKILIDDREHQSKVGHYLKELGAEIELKRLDVGDYVISDRCVIERKRGDDFASSLFDKRLFDQIVRMKDVYDIVVLCIEDFDLMFYRYPDKVNVFYGALASLSLFGVSIIPIQNEYALARLVFSMAKKEQDPDDSHEPIARANPKNKSWKARRLYFIQGLINVGGKKANILLSRFGTPYNVIKSIADTLCTEKKITDGPFKVLDGFGVKFILENKKLLLGDDE